MRVSRVMGVAVLVVVAAMALAGFAMAEDLISAKGKIVSYDLDAKTMVVNMDEGGQMTFVVENAKALRKLDDRLFVGDEVKIKYSVKDGKNIISGPNDLKGTKPGC